MGGKRVMSQTERGLEAIIRAHGRRVSKRRRITILKEMEGHRTLEGCLVRREVSSGTFGPRGLLWGPPWRLWPGVRRRGRWGNRGTPGPSLYVIKTRRFISSPTWEEIAEELENDKMIDRWARDIGEWPE